MLPIWFAAALAALTWFAPADPGIRPSLLGAAACLAAWAVAVRVAQRGRILSYQVVLRPQHYLQACAQGSVLLYWGWYWREVYLFAPLIAAQLLFAYAVDILLAWSRGRAYALGFSPVPVIFSINLFLWFRPGWFWLQFVMIAVAFGAKEFLRWTRNGRRVHIFNPSAFPLALTSLALILTGATALTRGDEIANTLNYAPHIYLVIFLIALPGQLLFGVTTMTMAAVVSMYVFGLIYFAVAGTYFFFDSYIPIAVFLGMHLLFTDPSTSPRTDVGRVMFGVLYASGVIVLYDALGRLGVPTFYDKLLPVPLMNLTVRVIDRIAHAGPWNRLDLARILPQWTGRRRNVAYVSLWAALFVLMSAVQGVGDSHRGQWVPFWQRACAEERPTACRNLGVLVSGYCGAGSGWACNEYGILLQPALRPDLAARAFQRACDAGFSPGCANSVAPVTADPQRMPPGLEDYAIVLRGLKGPLRELEPVRMYALACVQGFAEACQMACDLGDQRACARGLARSDDTSVTQNKD